MSTRLTAAGWHLLISGFFAAMSAALVFGIWYPGLFAGATDIQHIYLLILMVDVVLGPAMTLVIFDTTRKGRRELKRDLCVIALIQSAALLYGLHTAYVARPIYVVFSVDRFDLVLANSIRQKNLGQVTDPRYQSLPIGRPRLIAAKLPQDAKLKSELVDSALAGGGDLPEFPQYYVEYDTLRQEAARKAEPLENLYPFNKAHPADVDALIKRYRSRSDPVGFLPLKVKETALTVILDKTTGEVLEYVDLQPWS